MFPPNYLGAAVEVFKESLRDEVIQHFIINLEDERDSSSNETENEEALKPVFLKAKKQSFSKLKTVFFKNKPYSRL